MISRGRHIRDTRKKSSILIDYLRNYIWKSDPSIALKDLNVIEKKFKLKLSKENAEVIMDQINKDCKFFEECSIIDYSLLIGVHNFSQIRMESLNIDDSSVDFMSLKNSKLVVGS